MKRYFEVFTRKFLSCLIATVLLSGSLLAQVSTADITGRILDSQGNAIPGANVTATNSATGLTRTASSNDDGEYIITQLPPGIYEITVEAKGFSRSLQKDFELNVGTKPTLNFELKAGGVAETIEVQGGAPLIETTGDPVFCSAWSLLGAPSITLPLLKGEHGLPIGVQIVGRQGDNVRVLRAAEWLWRKFNR